MRMGLATKAEKYKLGLWPSLQNLETRFLFRSCDGDD